MKIGLCGSHGTLKTTTLKEFLKDNKNFESVFEIARNCPFNVNEGASYLAQKWILHEQIKKELLNYPNNQICDRTTLDQMAYINSAFLKGNINLENANELIRICECWVLTYDIIFYFPIEYPIENDGFRSTNKHFQLEIDDTIKSYLNFMPIRDKIFDLSGTVKNKVSTIQKVINAKK